MRILIVTPKQNEATGNQVTARRYQRGLEQLGHCCKAISVTVDTPGAIDEEVASFAPDLIHLIHAYRTGKPWLEGAAAKGIPAIVSLAGTDFNHGLASPTEGPVIREVLSRAAAVVTQNLLTAKTIKKDLPEFALKLRYLSPAIELGEHPWSLRVRHAIDAQDLLFLHPAGIRPVKGNLELLEAFSRLPDHTGMRLAFCGPILDPAYGLRLLGAIDRHPWAIYLGVIPPAAMPATLVEADVILNNSQSEGLSNVLVEASALGRPILARNIAGNAAIVRHGRNGLLYKDQEDLRGCITTLVENVGLRRSLSRPTPSRFAPEREAKRLERIYLQCLVPEDTPALSHPACK